MPSKKTTTPRRRFTTHVNAIAVKHAPWYAPANLHVKHEGQQNMLTEALRQGGREKCRKHALLVHSIKCRLAVDAFPIVVDSDDAKQLAHAWSEARRLCRCIPLVMYTGAHA